MKQVAFQSTTSKPKIVEQEDPSRSRGLIEDQIAKFRDFQREKN